MLFRSDVQHVTLVDIDPAMTDLGTNFSALRVLNQQSYSDPRLQVVHEDALMWLDTEVEPFDVVIIDFPDPSTFAIGKLYSTTFYRRLLQRLADDAVIAIQCTSPLTAPKSFWCVLRTVESVGLQAVAVDVEQQALLGAVALHDWHAANPPTLAPNHYVDQSIEQSGYVLLQLGRDASHFSVVRGGQIAFERELSLGLHKLEQEISRRPEQAEIGRAHV